MAKTELFLSNNDVGMFENLLQKNWVTKIFENKTRSPIDAAYDIALPCMTLNKKPISQKEKKSGIY